MGEIKLSIADYENHSSRYVGCLILTSNHKFLLQQRGIDWERYPAALATFGGKIELGETPEQALARELKEELGAKIIFNHVTTLGTFIKNNDNCNEFIYGYFWHDIKNTITGCYEGEAKYYDNYTDALQHPKILDDTRWLINAFVNHKIDLASAIKSAEAK